MGIGDWGLGIGDWGLGIGPNPQSPIPNPQSPIPNSHLNILKQSFNIIIFFNYLKTIMKDFKMEGSKGMIGDISIKEEKSNGIKWILLATTLIFLITTIIFICLYVHEKQKDKEKISFKDLYNNIEITDEWDKTFQKSDKVNHKKITFHNRFGITLVGDLYEPKEKGTGKLAAIAVSGPFGAVKEQSSGLYAQNMAERGFITLAFDPSFTGESGGLPRYLNSPDINTDDFSAAVDYLSLQENIDPEKISIIGICGFGGFSLNAAAIDPRIKVTIVSTMYDMSRVIAYGYNDVTTPEQRYETKITLGEQRLTDYKNGFYATQGGILMSVLVKDSLYFYNNIGIIIKQREDIIKDL
jgi:hypothetical protein